jgi:hypothetical protein
MIQYNLKSKKQCHYEVWVSGRARERPRAKSRLCYQVEFTQVVRFLNMEKKEVSVGPHSTGHEPGRTAFILR